MPPASNEAMRAKLKSAESPKESEFFTRMIPSPAIKPPITGYGTYCPTLPRSKTPNRYMASPVNSPAAMMETKMVGRSWSLLTVEASDVAITPSAMAGKEMMPPIAPG